MMFIEILLLIILCVIEFTLFKVLSGNKRIFQLIFLLLCVSLQIVFNRFQWQMYPAYLLSSIFMLGLVSVLILKPDKAGKVIKIIIFIIGIICLILSTVLILIFPVKDLPEPTGKYYVGTRYFHLKDETRQEILTAESDDIRQFSVRIWYPADSNFEAENMYYKKNYHQTGCIESDIPPAFIFKHYNIMKANSYLDIPISSSNENFPVLVFSPGFLADSEDYQIYLETLASYGYIVLAPEQPFESKSVLIGNEIIPFIDTHQTSYEIHKEIIYPLWKEFWNTKDIEKRNAISLKIIEEDQFMDKILRIRVQDIQSMLDEFISLSNISDDMFFRKFDFTRLGILGHSLGGAVAGQACLIDERFKAGLNLDGFQWGDVIDGSIQQPFMIMYSDPFAYANNFILDNFNNTLYQLVIKGSTHSNFDDNMVVMPITKQIGMLGSIDTNRMREINNEYIVSFFDKYLKNKETTLFDNDLKFSEVEFTTYNN